MAANVNRWMKYAKARLDAALGQGNDELDRLEAEREAELADKPWLRSDGDAPSFEEARARIEWETERQKHLAEDQEGSEPASAEHSGPGSGASPRSDRVEDNAEAAARESARLELEERQRQSAARLDEIRQELGIDPAGSEDPEAPEDPAASG